MKSGFLIQAADVDVDVDVVLLSNSYSIGVSMASTEEIRELGKATAKALRDAGKSVGAVFDTTPTTEVRSSGFLGLKKETITHSRTTSKPLGWRLWTQHLAQTEEKIGLDYVTTMKIKELWLSSVGELTVVEINSVYYGTNSHRDSATSSVRHASDDDLAHPDYQWTEQNRAPQGDQWLLRQSVWVPSLPTNATRYGAVERSLREIQSG